MGLLSKLKVYLRRKRLARRQPAEIFIDYARRNKWGDKQSLSGKGSNLEATAELRESLPRLLRELGTSSLLDLPCGDFFWMEKVDLSGIEYLGGDIVPALVSDNQKKHGRPGRSFKVIDIIDGPVPKADVVIVRDCLVHLSTEHVRRALANIVASGSTWLLTTTYPDTGTNAEIPTGDWRPINLTAQPFCLPHPERMLFEGQAHMKGQRADKALGMWRIDAIQSTIKSFEGRIL